jgi:hypothetical protein
LTDIQDWWRGTNANGEEGLFPSNYVELIQDQEEVEEQTAPVPAAAPRGISPEPQHQHEEPAGEAPGAVGHTAVALYDYEATEDNELSFPDGALIEDIQFPDEDWWHGQYNNKEGLFVSISSVLCMRR